MPVSKFYTGQDGTLLQLDSYTAVHEFLTHGPTLRLLPNRDGAWDNTDDEMTPIIAREYAMTEADTEAALAQYHKRFGITCYKD